ncbi:MAG: hypothetical protein J5I53_00235 [Bradyrhizobiaceae bacterium]|nr:hypothetical protein [Bradyrhizobiaceae bacterium]
MTQPNVIDRAGRYVQQPSGFRAFYPAPLPPSSPVELDTAPTALLSEADGALGRLDDSGLTLPNAAGMACNNARAIRDSSTVSGWNNCSTDLYCPSTTYNG